VTSILEIQMDVVGLRECWADSGEEEAEELFVYGVNFKRLVNMIKLICMLSYL